MFSKISQNSQKNVCVKTSFLTKLDASAFTFIEKEGLGQVISCTFWENFKNSFLYRTIPVALLEKNIPRLIFKEFHIM